MRLHIEVPEHVRVQLDRLVVETRASSLTSVLRRALAVYDALLQVSSGGGSVVLRSRDGREREILLVGDG